MHFIESRNANIQPALEFLHRLNVKINVRFNGLIYKHTAASTAAYGSTILRQVACFASFLPTEIDIVRR